VWERSILKAAEEPGRTDKQGRNERVALGAFIGSGENARTNHSTTEASRIFPGKSACEIKTLNRSVDAGVPRMSATLGMNG
jgi:hypothetical protein